MYFLDFNKAFERVEHEILLIKLKNTDIPTNILREIESILRKITICVKYKNEVSGRWNARRDVRQGSVLLPHVFVFYIVSLIREVSELPYGCRVGINKFNLQAYGDDIVVICSSPTGLRILIEAPHYLFTAH